MEQNKLEKEIRNQLNQQSIQPSENSWDRLDAMLTVDEHKNKRSFQWLYIAASFVGFTLIGFFLFNQQKNELQIIPEKNVVEEEKQSFKINDNPLVLENSSISETKQSTQVATIVYNLEKSKSPSKIDPKKEQVLDRITAVSSERDVEISIQSNATLKINPKTLLASVENGESLSANSVSSTSSIKVDANSLLTSVEKEVDESFRDKVLQTLNKNYKSVKSMLVNRNSQ